MAHVDEFEYLHAVAVRFKKFRAKRVGEEGCHPFADNAVFKCRSEDVAARRMRFIVGELGVQLVLATGYGKNDAGAPPDCLRERVVRRGIAGMQRDYHIGMVEPFIVRDVADREAYVIVPVFERETGAMPDHVGLEVQSDNFHPGFF